MRVFQQRPTDLHGVRKKSRSGKILLSNQDLVAQARQAGWRMLSYTVNEPSDATRLEQLATDGVVTDRIDLFAPSQGAILTS